MMPTQSFTQEIGVGCNLTHKHIRCPARYPDKLRGNLDSSRLMTDDMIVENAIIVWDQGFRRYFAWQFYSEPTLHFERLERVQARIKEARPEAKFLLWTNGVLLGKEIALERCNIFDLIVWSNYVKENRDDLRDRLAPLSVRVCSGRLDMRMQGIPDNHLRCGRLKRELVIDAYGNWRLCCGDWEGTAVKMNVFDTGLMPIIEAWRDMVGKVMQRPQPTGLPAICSYCTVR